MQEPDRKTKMWKSRVWFERQNHRSGKNCEQIPRRRRQSSSPNKTSDVVNSANFEVKESHLFRIFTANRISTPWKNRGIPVNLLWLKINESVKRNPDLTSNETRPFKRNNNEGNVTQDVPFLNFKRTCIFCRSRVVQRPHFATNDLIFTGLTSHQPYRSIPGFVAPSQERQILQYTGEHFTNPQNLKASSKSNSLMLPQLALC